MRHELLKEAGGLHFIFPELRTTAFVPVVISYTPSALFNIKLVFLTPLAPFKAKQIFCNIRLYNASKNLFEILENRSIRKARMIHKTHAIPASYRCN